MLLWVCLSIDHRRVAHDVQSSASMLFFPNFDVSDRLQKRRTTTWSVFVGGDPNWFNLPSFLATPIISCTAKSSQFAVGSPNPSSPSTISLMGTLSKTVVTFSSSSSGLKTFEKNGVVKC